MTFSIISFTKKGFELSLKLNNAIADVDSSYSVKLYIKCESFKEKWISSYKDKACYVEDSLKQWTGIQFEKKNVIIYIGSSGIAVRSIAKYVDNKLTDSPVIVVDEKGEYVIPLLSGHVGGANAIAIMLAEKLGACPVITTATDKNNVWAADLFAKKNNLSIINKDGIKKVNAKSLNGEIIKIRVPDKIKVASGYNKEKFDVVSFDYTDLKNSDLDNTDLDNTDLNNTDLNNTDLVNADLNNIDLVNSDFDNIDVWLLDKEEDVEVLMASFENNQYNVPLFLSQKEYIIGIGCKKGKTEKEVEDAINDALKINNLKYSQIALIASIDLKNNEQGILDFSNKNRIEFVTFKKDELLALTGDFEESEFVKDITGVGNVCERAAICACKNGGYLIQKKIKYEGITIAIAKRNLITEIEL